MMCICPDHVVDHVSWHVPWSCIMAPAAKGHLYGFYMAFCTVKYLFVSSLFDHVGDPGAVVI